MKKMFDVSGKVAVVTGGSRGIGAMIAHGLVENGAKVYITARKEPELRQTEKTLQGIGDCTAFVSDLSNVAGIEKFVGEVAARDPKVDILINNAGAAWGAPIDDYPESGWDKTMDLNVKSIFFLTQKFLPALRAAGTQEDPSRIVNIASINGITNPKADNYAYSASKAAVIHLTRHLAADLVRDHININAIAPGFFPSKMTAFLMEDEGKAVASRIPRGRIGHPEDIAGTAIYLCSQASSWVIGQTIAVDGGMVASAG